MKPAREPASSRPKPCASLKKPHESCPFAAPCGPRRKKNDRGQRSAFPSETSRSALLILAHRGSALPWLVNDQAALRLRRIHVVSHVSSNSILFAESGDPLLLLFANKERSSTERRMEGGIADETSMPPLKCECFGSAA